MQPIITMHKHVIFAFLLIVSLIYVNGSSIDGRHSYSLTTFDPSGNLDQVGRAVRASMLGAPLVALSIPSSPEIVTTPDSESTSTSPDEGIYMCIPLRFLMGTSSPLIIDDGTPRIVPISSSISICHTGVGADGRVLCDIAVKIALDYRYIYGEEISQEELLEALAEKVQEMTMRAGGRPYGCALLVASLGNDQCRGATMYRIDPSGSVELLNANNSEDESKPLVACLGKWNRQKEQSFRSQLCSQQFTNEQQVKDALMNGFENDQDAITTMQSTPSDRGSNQTFLYASFTRKYGLRISRIIKENHDGMTNTSI